LTADLVGSRKHNKIDFAKFPSAAFICDESRLETNLEVLDYVQRQTQCKILLALKGFAMFSVFPLLRKTLYGVTASSLYEARLGFEEFKRETHIYAPAYIPNEFDELLNYIDHIIFNSNTQLEKYSSKIQKYNNSKKENRGKLNKS